MDKTEIVKVSDIEPEIITEVVSAESLIPDRQAGTHSMEIIEEREDGWVGFCKNCKKNVKLKKSVIPKSSEKKYFYTKLAKKYGGSEKV